MVLPDSHRIPRVPWYLGNELEASTAFAYGAVTLCRSTFQLIRLAGWFVTSRLPRGGATLAPATPPEKRPRAITLRRFGLFPVRSPLLGESLLLSFPGGTEMVHFPPFAYRPLWIQRRTPGHDSGSVAPFGDPRVEACVRLTGAYRSLPRPSSPSCAKASTVRP
jgi:hypothetical protein